MEAAFYISSLIAIAATLMVVAQRHVIHALLYLVLSLLAVAVVLYTLGAPFAAAVEVIVYAGAIVVLFVFVVMMLNIGGRAIEQERRWLTPATWLLPALFAAILLLVLVAALASEGATAEVATVVTPKGVGLLLFGPYLLGVELASMLLLAALVGAYHIGRREPGEE